MKYFWSLIVMLSLTIFYLGIKASAHPVDIHLPTSYDYMHENEYEKDRANLQAEKTLSNPDASITERQEALEHLHGPQGNRA